MSSIQKVRRFGLIAVCASAAAFLLAAPASARADDTYAAIAFNSKTGHFGFASHFDSKEKAEKEALAICSRLFQDDDAEVVVGVKNGYCSLVFGDNAYAVAIDSDSPAKAYAIARAAFYKATGNKKSQMTAKTIGSMSANGKSFAFIDAPPGVEQTISPDFSGLQAEIIRLTNVERKKAGVPELKVSAKLTAVEEKYARFMAQKDKLAHDLDGDPGDRFTRDGYKWMRWGECANFDRADAAAVVKSWMDDKPHHDVMVDPNLTEIGCGVAANADGKLYYVLGFGTPPAP